MFHYRLRHSARPGGSVRKLQHVARRIRGRDVRGAVVHAAMDAVHYREVRSHARQ